MNVTPNIRKRAFRAALAANGQSLAQWSDDHDVTAHHVGLVLNNKRPSAQMVAEIDAYTARILPPFIADYVRRTAAA